MTTMSSNTESKLPNPRANRPYINLSAVKRCYQPLLVTPYASHADAIRGCTLELPFPGTLVAEVLSEAAASTEIRFN